MLPSPHAAPGFDDRVARLKRGHAVEGSTPCQPVCDSWRPLVPSREDPSPPLGLRPPPMTVLAVIPTRLASTRLARKVLADLGGQPLFLHAVAAARAARAVDEVLVATDSEAVVAAAARAGVRALLTDPACASGTDRVAEIAQRHPAATILVNVQADEPFLDPRVIDATVDALRADRGAALATPAAPLADESMAAAAQVVTVVCDQRGRALYFSRAALPMYRDAAPRPVAPWLRHIGLYAYRREALLALAATPRTPLEIAESLEQLRALETGQTIRVVIVAPQFPGVDTADDLDAARREWVRRIALASPSLSCAPKETA